MEAIDFRSSGKSPITKSCSGKFVINKVENSPRPNLAKKFGPEFRNPPKA